MSEEERLRFAQEESEGSDDRPSELDFDDPRSDDNMGPGFSSVTQEVSNPENRDGAAALLDDEAHEQAVQEQTRNRQPRESDGE